MFGKKKEVNENQERKEIGLKKFIFRSVSELWSYELWTYIIVYVLIRLIVSAAKMLVMTRDDALTTSNLTYVLFSPQGVPIVFLAVLAILVYIAIEIFGEIIFVGDLFESKKTGSVISRILSAIKEGFESLKLFFNPLGVLCLLYIFIISPLIGIGFTISLTDEFYVPNFIMDVIKTKPLFAVPYFSFMFAMAVIGVMYAFTFYGVLLRKETVKEAMRNSRLIVKKNWKKLLLRVIRLLLVLILIRIAIGFLIEFEAVKALANINAKVPNGYVLTKEGLSSSNVLDIKAFVIRTFSAFVLLEGGFIEIIFKIVCDAILMIEITRFYYEYSNKLHGDSELVYREQAKRVKYWPKVLVCIMASVLFAIFAIVVGVTSEEILHNDKTAKIIAHRAGGFLASENSIDGLKVAIENNCFGAETDIQRTKDGHYIINHDDDFKRLTGVAKAPKDMTLDEIRELKIQDTTGSGKVLQVPTLEEFLDTIKGKIKLFIELKGVTADKQMVEDVVRIVKEKGCENDVVLISLKYDIMNYAEDTYSEMDTGVLCFGGFGDVNNLHVDYILMEEEMAQNFINQVEEKGKTSGIWTVNTEDGMVKAFDSGADTIITDDINLYNTIKNDMKNRTDFEVLKDWCLDFIK